MNIKMKNHENNKVTYICLYQINLRINKININIFIGF